MELSVDLLYRIKLGLHVAQVLLIFTSWIIEIVYFTQAPFTGGDVNWFFALCFLTIPALIYLTVPQRFPRSRKWVNPYATASIDVLFAILWLSAWAAVAAWNASGLCESVYGCSLTRAMIGLGFLIFFSFALTAAISIYGAIYFRRNGVDPSLSRIPANAAMIDPDREAFSTAPHDEYAPIQIHDRDEYTTGDQRNAPSTYDDTYGASNGQFGASGYGNTSYNGRSNDHNPSYYKKDTTFRNEASSDRLQFPGGDY